MPFLIFGAYGIHLSLMIMMMTMINLLLLMLCVFAHTHYHLFTDLYPVGHWVNQTGVIVVRYLPAITPTEATSRDDMMRLVSDKEDDHDDHGDVDDDHEDDDYDDHDYDDDDDDDDIHCLTFDRNKYGR